MTDRELLELAAKAAGIKYEKYYDVDDGSLCIVRGQRDFELWNPLSDDGDAFRLAVKLQLDILQFGILMAMVQYDTGEIKVFDERHDNDAYKATRRAIVRAAAEIGKTK